MRFTTIIIALVCLISASVQAADSQRLEVSIGDAQNTIIGLEFKINSHGVIQVRINQNQAELFTPLAYSFNGNGLQKLILQSWHHRYENGLHILSFDLPEGVHLISVLGKKEGTRINKTTGEIMNASHEGDFIVSLSKNRVVSLPGSAVSPKRQISFKNVSPNCRKVFSKGLL